MPGEWYKQFYSCCECNSANACGLSADANGWWCPRKDGCRSLAGTEKATQGLAGKWGGVEPGVEQIWNRVRRRAVLAQEGFTGAQWILTPFPGLILLHSSMKTGGGGREREREFQAWAFHLMSTRLRTCGCWLFAFFFFFFFFYTCGLNNYS